MKSAIASAALLCLAAASGVSAQNSSSLCPAPLPFEECLANVQKLSQACQASDLPCACRTGNEAVFCYVNFCGGVASTHGDYPAATCKRNQACQASNQNITTPGWAGSCNNIPSPNNPNANNGTSTNGGNGTSNGSTNGNSTTGNGSSALSSNAALAGWAMAAVAGLAFLL